MTFLASLDVPAGADTPLYTMLAGDPKTVNLRWCNRNASNDVKVKCAITSGGAPAAKDWIDFNCKVLAEGILEDTGLRVSTNEVIYVNADLAGISVRLHGG